LANSRHGVVNSPCKLAVCLRQSDLHGGVGVTPSHVHRIPARFVGSGSRTYQALSSGEFLLFRDEYILIAKKFVLIHDHSPVINPY
jgi:hypothetical protein